MVVALNERRSAPPPVYQRTDLGNAERLVGEHGRDLRYAPGIGWFTWDGRRWKRDADGEVMRRAKLTVREIYVEAAGLEDDRERRDLVAWATSSESESRLRHAVKLAETEFAVIVAPEKLDADPWLLNVANGTIDLRTGELWEHRREDLLTRFSGVVYDPKARSDVWDTFIETVTSGDTELADFLQRATGYSLTGDVSEEVILFAHGPTATGKSTYLEAIRVALGEYAAVADFETFLKRRGDAGIRNDIARLAGARMVVSVEVDEGKTLAEGLLKVLTGGDTVTARFLYKEAFEFRPQLKLWLAANARPRVNADDTAMWRRILQVPFVAAIPENERDPKLKRRLKADPRIQSAIIAWAVGGCLEWQRVGLAPPKAVVDYTAEYRAENDPLSEWLADRCERQAGAFTPTKDLRASYEEWAAANGESEVSGRALATKLTAHGCRNVKLPGGTRGWRDIRVT